MRMLPPASCFLAVLFALNVAHAQPGPDWVLVGEDADSYYYMKKAEYKNSAAEKTGAQYRKARLRVTAGQEAIRQLGFTTDSERFALYEGVAREQKEELQNKIFDALFDQALEGTTMLAQSAKSLNPWNVNKAIEMLKEKGFKNEAVMKALRKIASVQGKPEMAAAYKEFTECVKAAKEGWNTGKNQAKEPEHAEAHLALGMLKVLQGNPELGLIVTAVEFSESIAYLYYLTGEVKELTKVTDEKLKTLATLSEKLKKDVAEMNAAKKAWQKATGHVKAAPVLSEQE